MLVTINEKRFSMLQVVELRTLGEGDIVDGIVGRIELINGHPIDLTEEEHTAVRNLWDRHAEVLTPCREGNLPEPVAPTGRDFGDDWANDDRQDDAGGEGEEPPV